MSLLLLFGGAPSGPINAACDLTNKQVIAAEVAKVEVRFGRETENTSTLGAVAAKLHGTRFTLGSWADIDTVHARLSNTATGHQACAAKAAIYSSSYGEPDELLGYSGNVTIADNLSLRWVDFELSSAVRLRPSDYFIAIWVSYDGSGVQLRYLNLQGKTYFRAWSSSGAPPDPFGFGAEDFYMLELNIYATGVAAPSGPANISCAMQNGCELVVTADGGTPPVVSYAACDLVNAQVTDAGPISAVMAACAMVNRSELEAAPYAQQGVLYTGASLISGARLRARALRAAQLEDLPPTDDLGWTLPDAAPSPLWDLSVTIGTFRVPNALITNLTIDLDDHCGYESCAISFASRRARRWPSRAQIVVAYDSQNLFEGRLKTQRRNIGTELGWSLEFVGNLNALRDHRAFRRVYADSDLENWRLDQPGGSAGSGD